MPIGRIGQDSIVNSTIDNNQGSPSIAALADGRFVATWTSSDSGDGSVADMQITVAGTNFMTGTDFIA